MSAPERSTGRSDGDQATAQTGTGRRGLVAAGVFLVVVLAVGLFLAVVPSRDPEPIAGGSPSAVPVTSAAPSQAAPSGCQLPVGDQTVPVTPPADTEWELVGRVVAPTAPEVHGPGVTDPVRSCFARTPTGALYAAVNALATTTLPDAPRLLAEDLGAEGPGRDAALSQLPTDGSTVPASDAATQVQLAGFQFLSYNEDETVIDLALLGVTDAQTVTAHTAFTVRWERDDWRVVHNTDGAPFSPIQTIPGLAGYVPWSGT